MSSNHSPFHEFEQAAWKDAARTYARFWRSLTSQAAPHLLDAARVQQETLLLDVATGPGDIAFSAIERRAQVIGIDFSEEMIQIAEAAQSKADFRIGDA